MALVEPSMLEQRYLAVREVLDTGASVTDVATRHGIDRRTLHRWLVRYANEGMGRRAAAVGIEGLPASSSSLGHSQRSPNVWAHLCGSHSPANGVLVEVSTAVRCRIGEANQVVSVLDIDHRGDVYRRLKFSPSLLVVDRRSPPRTTR